MVKNAVILYADEYESLKNTLLCAIYEIRKICRSGDCDNIMEKRDEVEHDILKALEILDAV